MVARMVTTLGKPEMPPHPSHREQKAPGTSEADVSNSSVLLMTPLFEMLFLKSVLLKCRVYLSYIVSAQDSLSLVERANATSRAFRS